ncbi:MAG: OmpA family protein [Alphaproteobacteria bacterium]|nr:OmpA family protein [Alphaproteobacteria bacterium]
MTRSFATVRTHALAALFLLAVAAPAAAQDDQGMNINMDALQHRPADQAKPPAKPAEQTPKQHKTFTGKSVTVLFQPGSDALDAAATERLDTVAATAPHGQRLELMAYAGTAKQSASETHRLALKRAIAVRGYLMKKGMDGTRISVRPQGPAAEGGAPERVDVRYLAE